MYSTKGHKWKRSFTKGKSLLLPRFRNRKLQVSCQGRAFKFRRHRNKLLLPCLLRLSFRSLSPTFYFATISPKLSLALCLLCFDVNICQTEFYCLYDERNVYKCILKGKTYRIKVLWMFLQFEIIFRWFWGLVSPCVLKCGGIGLFDF